MKTEYVVYGTRYNKIDPIIDYKTKEVIDDGTPKQVTLGRFSNKIIAEGFMENLLKNVKKRTWKIWVE